MGDRQTVGRARVNFQRGVLDDLRRHPSSRNYRHDLARVVSDTVRRWDAREAAEKIELQVGKDLQFIRINGTVVGSLAGLAIYTIATLVILPLTA